MLNDFSIIKSSTPRMFRKFFGSVAGYCVALVVRTLPAAVISQRHQIRVRVTTNGTTAWVDHRRGDVCIPLPTNTTTSMNNTMVVYDGPAGILAASTVPFYGGGLKLFPFARTNNNDSTMHLRIGNIHPLRGFFNIPRIFAGTFRNRRRSSGENDVVDLLGTDFTIQVQGRDGGPYPLQHSGESVGAVREFRVRVADAPIRFVSFWPSLWNR